MAPHVVHSPLAQAGCLDAGRPSAQPGRSVGVVRMKVSSTRVARSGGVSTILDVGASTVDYRARIGQKVGYG